MRTISLQLLWRTSSFNVSLKETDQVVVLQQLAEEKWKISVSSQVLICNGRKLVDNTETLGSLWNRSKQPVSPLRILVLASLENERQQVKEARSDPLVKPFEESRRPVVSRASKWSSRNTAQKKSMFKQLRPLEQFPDSSRSLELLQRIATERGVVAVMEKHNMSLSCLREMYPHGQVGVDPVCVLGLNTGTEIHIRLRTDDLQGFRSYDKILEVLFHELAHCRFAEHNKEFYAFMKQLQTEAEQADWTKQGGRRLTNHILYEGTVSEENNKVASWTGYTGKLGDGNVPSFLSAPEAAAMAAMNRFNQQNEKNFEKEEIDESTCSDNQKVNEPCANKGKNYSGRDNITEQKKSS
eukprot:jgi/Galph1/2555/GphlegSOOS_G1212.1